jgi:cyclohexyl-isocyanide hydratase
MIAPLTRSETMNRRDFAAAVATAAAVGAGRPGRAQTSSAPTVGTQDTRQSAGAPFQIGMIIFDNMTNQDFVGPHDVFARVRAAQVHVLAKTLAPVTTDSKLQVLPQLALKDAPPLDLIFIGGGGGTTPLMEDAEMIGFLQSRAPRAQYLTSVCTGALVLGAAGLLQGYKAATHWAAMGVLPLLGAEPVHQRVVFDRNRVTGGGVTAGIDFGLAVVGKLWGDELAQMIQLGMEYAPEPPYNAGTPDSAPPEITRRVTESLSRMTGERMAAARRISAQVKSG